jgi:hypothetical protein
VQKFHPKTKEVHARRNFEKKATAGEQRGFRKAF